MFCCDSLHKELTCRRKNSSDDVPKKLESESASQDKIDKVSYINDEPKFRWELLADQMAFEKLHEGIRGFAKDGMFSSTCSGLALIRRNYRPGTQGHPPREAFCCLDCSTVMYTFIRS